MKLFLITIIHAYQRMVSPFLGRHCRFYPSCSEYAEEAIRTRGVLRGSVRAAARLLKCHPLHPGGWDPVETRT